MVNKHLQVNILCFWSLFINIIILDDALNSANAAAQANALAPFLGLGGNLAALAGVSNSVNNLSVASSLNAANTLIQQQLGGLLASSAVVLVSNLDENVSFFLHYDFWEDISSVLKKHCFSLNIEK